MIDILTSICNKIWKTGDCPTIWTQSLVVTLPKEDDLQLYQNYRTISLISRPIKVMLKFILKIEIQHQCQVANIIRVIEKLYDKAQSTGLFNGSTRDWFRTTVGVRQECLLSSTIFNIVLERITCEALDDHESKCHHRRTTYNVLPTSALQIMS